MAPWYEEVIDALLDALPLIPVDTELYVLVNRAINALMDDAIADGMDLLREAEALMDDETDPDVRDVIKTSIHG